MELNWDCCILCQKDTAEPLKCPLRGPLPGTSDGDKTDAYSSFLSNVEQFRAIDALPTELYFGNDETASSFASHSASWHKSCHLKFNNSKLAKAKEKANPDDSRGRKLMKRRALDVQKCFLCEGGLDQGVLHEVSTFDTDKNILTMITELNYTMLIARRVGGDLIAMEAKYHLPCLVKLRNLHRSLTRKSGNQHTTSDSFSTGLWMDQGMDLSLGNGKSRPP